jgi:hypothetical protein
MSIDFEKFGDTTWATFGCVIAQYPTGRIFDTFQIGNLECDRKETENRKRFWTKHHQARDYNETLIRLGLPQFEAEQKIIDKLESYFTKYPNLVVVCDSIGFDGALLNQIFLSHGRRPIEQRNQAYRQTVDWWSFRRGMCVALRTTAAELAEQLSSIPMFDHLLQKHPLPHTVIHDCGQTLLRYFQLLNYSQRVCAVDVSLLQETGDIEPSQ